MDWELLARLGLLQRVQQCSYIQAQRATVSLSAQKAIGVFKKLVQELKEREATGKATYEWEVSVLEGLRVTQDQKAERQGARDTIVRDRQRQLGTGVSIRKTRPPGRKPWRRRKPRSYGPRARTRVTSRRSSRTQQVRRSRRKQQVSERERGVDTRFVELAKALGALGRYVPADLKGRSTCFELTATLILCWRFCWETYRQRRMAACSGGAHPGLLIFDCPREREMSPQLYDRFLRLANKVCEGAPGVHVILTTTTPPPELLREPPTSILKLSHASDDDLLLLKRRIANLLSCSIPSPRGEEGKEDGA